MYRGANRQEESAFGERVVKSEIVGSVRTDEIDHRQRCLCRRYQVETVNVSLLRLKPSSTTSWL
jgi:hypothetical protein